MDEKVRVIQVPARPFFRKADELVGFNEKKRGQVRSWRMVALAALKAGARTLPSTTEIPLKLKGSATETPDKKPARENEPKRDLSP